LITGITVVQRILGIISILLNNFNCKFYGFELNGSAAVFILIEIPESLLTIVYKLIIAAFTKTINEVPVIGYYALFLFIHITRASFQLSSKEEFTVLGYQASLQGLMSPIHGNSALNKIMIAKMKQSNIIREII
jgi:hypothetical protein